MSEDAGKVVDEESSVVSDDFPKRESPLSCEFRTLSQDRMSKVLDNYYVDYVSYEHRSVSHAEEVRFCRMHV